MNQKQISPNENEIGIIIFEESLEIYPIEFIGLTYLTKSLPDSVEVKWKSSYPHNDNGLTLRIGYYEKIPSLKLNLYCFPPAIVESCEIDELEFPTKIAGTVVLVDTNYFFKSQPIIDGKPLSLNKAKWVLKQGIPIIIGVIYAKDISHADRVIFEKSVDIPPEIKIVWCDEGLSAEFQYDILSKLCSEISA